MCRSLLRHFNLTQMTKIQKKRLVDKRPKKDDKAYIAIKFPWSELKLNFPSSKYLMGPLTPDQRPYLPPLLDDDDEGHQLQQQQLRPFRADIVMPSKFIEQLRDAALSRHLIPRETLEQIETRFHLDPLPEHHHHRQLVQAIKDILKDFPS